MRILLEQCQTHENNEKLQLKVLLLLVKANKQEGRVSKARRKLVH